MHAVLFEVSAYDALFFDLNLTFIVRLMQEKSKSLAFQAQWGPVRGAGSPSRGAA